ncbi:MAG: hypothetical protein Q4D23_06120 [Bacteroidales bacterium]|nr:hypothetical protein [Bacteroidales bacterium]
MVATFAFAGTAFAAGAPDAVCTFPNDPWPWDSALGKVAWTDNGVTFSASGMNSSETGVEVGNTDGGAPLYIDSKKTIVKMVFNSTSAPIVASVGNLVGNVWTGSATSVQIYADYVSTDITRVEVYFEGDAPAEDAADASCRFPNDPWPWNSALGRVAWTDNGVTFSASGMNSSETGVEVGNTDGGSPLYIHSENNIVKMVFNTTSAPIVASVGNLDGNVWTGSATDIEIYADFVSTDITSVDVWFGEATVDPIETTVTYTESSYGGWIEVALSEPLAASFVKYPYELGGLVSVVNAGQKPIPFSVVMGNEGDSKVTISFSEAPAVGSYTVNIASDLVAPGYYGDFTVAPAAADPIETTVAYTDNGQSVYVEVALSEPLTASFLQYAYQLEGVVSVSDATGAAVEYGVVMGNEGDSKVTITFYEPLAVGSYTVNIASDLVAPGYYGDFTVAPAAADPIETTVAYTDNGQSVYVEVALSEPLTASFLQYAYQLEGVVSVSDATGAAVEYGVVMGNEGDSKVTITFYEPLAVGSYTVNIASDLVAPGYYGDFTVAPAAADPIETTVAYTDNGQSVYVEVALPNLAEGMTYNVVLPAGSIQFADGSFNNEINLVYTTEAAPVEVPVELATQYVYVTLPQTTTDSESWGTVWGEYKGAIPAGLEVLDPNGNALEMVSAYYNRNTTSLAIQLANVPSVAGYYTVNVPAGLTTGNAAALTGKFEVAAYVNVFDYAGVAEGEVQPEAFQYGLYVFTNRPFTAVDAAKVKINGQEVAAQFYGDADDPTIFVPLLNVEQGTYEVVIEKGSVKVGDYTYNEEIRLTYNVVVPVEVKVQQSGVYVNVTLPAEATDTKVWGSFLGEFQGEIPASLEVVDPRGNALEIVSAYYSNGSTILTIELADAPSVNGEYTVNVPGHTVTGFNADLYGYFTVVSAVEYVNIFDSAWPEAGEVAVESFANGLYITTKAPFEAVDGAKVTVNGEEVTTFFYGEQAQIFVGLVTPAPGTYTVVVPAGSVKVGDAYNREITLVYTVPGAEPVLPTTYRDPNMGSCYATFYADFAWTPADPATVRVFYVKGIAQAETDYNGVSDCIQLEEIKGTVPANTGVVLVTLDPIAVDVVKSSEVVAPIEGNLLRGVTTDQTVYAAGNEKLYKLSLDNNETRIAFYWDAPEGASLEAHANRAYLVVEDAAASNYRINLDATITGINSVLAPEAADAIYNLQGQRVLNATKSGIFVKDGQKYFVK